MNKSLGKLSGTLDYPEPINLPPHAVAIVELAGKPGGSANAQIIALESFTIEGRRFPLDFEMLYDLNEIDGRRGYFVQARIDQAADNFHFVSAEPLKVITRGHPANDLSIMMHRAPDSVLTGEVSGTVVHDEPVSLARDSVLIVRLEDVSRQDTLARIHGEQVYVTKGRQFPLPFRVTYDPAEIDDRFTYRVAVRIKDGSGILRFITDTIYPVITRGNPAAAVEIPVRAI